MKMYECMECMKKYTLCFLSTPTTYNCKRFKKRRRFTKEEN